MKKHTTDSLQISYTDKGKGICILLLHGFLESYPLWQEFIEKLAKTFRVIFPSLPGHEGTPANNPYILSPELIANYLDHFIKKISPGNFWILGHSLGGYIAFELVKKCSPQCLGLIVMDTHPYTDLPQKMQIRKKEIKFINAGKFKALVLAGLSSKLSISDKKQKERYLHLLVEAALMVATPIVVAYINGMLERKNNESIFAQNQFPTYLIYGSKDSSLPDEYILKLKTEIPDKLFEIQNAGHFPFLETPETLIEIINKLILQS